MGGKILASESARGVKQPHLPPPPSLRPRFLKDTDGMSFTRMCESPRTNKSPGQGMNNMSCNCQRDSQRNKCRKCKYGAQEPPRSMLCKC